MLVMDMSRFGGGLCKCLVVIIFLIVIEATRHMLASLYVLLLSFFPSFQPLNQSWPSQCSCNLQQYVRGLFLD